MTLDQLVDTGDFPIGATRRSIEDRIEKLIELLDIVDDDVDLEDTADDEPSLGCLDDLELDNCDDEDGHDAEGYCPDDYGETVMWPEDLRSQEVLVSP
ncbi:hypothetical protein ACFSQT_12085 [Mesorhizobium calcicola]|uniref:Uncharacterized protein n=1 Tax=Mesorhizobium calcicola TaxID=1300310 RepID=A0ABW4WDY0_9HYPH